jgi:GNAT superfamily N-acetyltransferase
VLEEQIFNPLLHDRAGFTCGDTALDEFFKKYAAQQKAKGVSTVFVVVDTGQPHIVLGFYTLSAAQLGTSHLSETEQKKLPRYPVPCFRMGRLACSRVAQGRGLGKLLVGLAVDRCIKAKADIGSYALLVDAKNETAAAFYRHFGFIACTDSPLTLYLPLGDTPPNEVAL